MDSSLSVYASLKILINVHTTSICEFHLHTPRPVLDISSGYSYLPPLLISKVKLVIPCITENFHCQVAIANGLSEVAQC